MKFIMYNWGVKKALMVYGGWERHEPERTTHKIAEGLRARDFKVEIFDTLDSYLLNDSQYDVIVQNWTMGEIKPDQLKWLLERIQSGTGFAGWHGGAGDSFRNEPEYQFMVGGQFVYHPAEIKPFKIQIVEPEDPIVKGLKDFEVTSEQYYMHVDPGNDVLAVSQLSGNSEQLPGKVNGHVENELNMPVAWKKMYGRGRVFYSSIGHSLADFDVPEVLELTLRGIAWAAGD